jgi:hypothetical protein
MIRSLCALGILLAATFLLPLWIQVLLYICAIIFIPNRVLFLLPAVIADLYYAPTTALTLQNLTTTLLVGGLLLVHWVVVHKTRIKNIYGLETSS